MNIKRTLFILPALALVACGSAPKRTFRIDAMDTGEEPLPGLIVIDQDWLGAAQKEQYVNVKSNDEFVIPLQFSGTSEHQIEFAPMRVEDGKPVSVPKTARAASEDTGYKSGIRAVKIGDSDRVMFIQSRTNN